MMSMNTSEETSPTSLRDSSPLSHYSATLGTESPTPGGQPVPGSDTLDERYLDILCMPPEERDPQQVFKIAELLRSDAPALMATMSEETPTDIAK